MKCPQHPDVELRREQYYSRGICHKCSKPYRMCTATKLLGICDLLEGHAGLHKDALGREWK